MGVSNGMLICPRTALLLGRDLWSVISIILVCWSTGLLVCWLLSLFIDIVYTEEGAGEGRRLAEGYEEALVDLSLRFDEDAAEEEDEAT